MPARPLRRRRLHRRQHGPARRSSACWRDIEAGKVDCVVVYKVDRLSRSLLDFARIMETFEQHGVSFVSVTQQFNTTHSMGRLTLNILLSFAQFEREIIGERIRDKIGAPGRKGKWTGGAPVLGYDVDRSGPSPKLVINAEEADRVREIFRMYLQEASLLPVVKELARRGWANKRRVTKKGRELGSRPFDKATLYQLLTKPVYTGKRLFKGELYPAEHEPIIEQELFDKVQHQLKSNGRSGGVDVRNKYARSCAACSGARVATRAWRTPSAAGRGEPFTATIAAFIRSRTGGTHAPPATSPLQRLSVS